MSCPLHPCVTIPVSPHSSLHPVIPVLPTLPHHALHPHVTPLFFNATLDSMPAPGSLFFVT